MTTTLNPKQGQQGRQIPPRPQICCSEGFGVVSHIFYTTLLSNPAPLGMSLSNYVHTLAKRTQELPSLRKVISKQFFAHVAVTYWDPCLTFSFQLKFTSYLFLKTHWYGLVSFIQLMKKILEAEVVLCRDDVPVIMLVIQRR